MKFRGPEAVGDRLQKAEPRHPRLAAFGQAGGRTADPATREGPRYRPGISNFCGSPLMWEVSLLRTFSRVMVISPLVIFTVP